MLICIRNKYMPIFKGYWFSANDFINNFVPTNITINVNKKLNG